MLLCIFYFMVVQYFITYFILNSNDVSIDVSEGTRMPQIFSFPYCSKTNLMLTVDFHYECLRAEVGCVLIYVL